MYAGNTLKEIAEFWLNKLMPYVSRLWKQPAELHLLQLHIALVRNNLDVLFRRDELWVSEHPEEVYRSIAQNSIEIV